MYPGLGQASYARAHVIADALSQDGQPGVRHLGDGGHQGVGVQELEHGGGCLGRQGRPHLGPYL